jgi:hypothetical protein
VHTSQISGDTRRAGGHADIEMKRVEFPFKETVEQAGGEYTAHASAFDHQCRIWPFLFHGITSAMSMYPIFSAGYVL